VNLTGTFNVTKAVFPSMRERRWGRVVCMASIAGLIGRLRADGLCTTKMGLIGFAKSIALEGARYNVTLQRDRARDRRAEREAVAVVRPHGEAGALQREGEPEDVASAIAFLCSERARYITGQFSA